MARRSRDQDKSIRVYLGISRVVIPTSRVITPVTHL